MPEAPRIGELLRRHGYTTREAVVSSLERQRVTGDAIGEILASEGHVRPYDLYRMLATQNALEFVNLLAQPPDEGVMRLGQADAYLRHGCVPWRDKGDTLVFACCRADPQTIDYITMLAGNRQVSVVLASPRDISRTVAAYFRPTLLAQARERLLKQAPHYSLRTASWKRMLHPLLAMVSGCALACYWWPLEFLSLGVALCNVFYLAAILLKPLLFYAGGGLPPLPTPQMLAHLPPERELPVYTILLPVYREEKGIPRLIRAIHALDYPKSRLDVKLVVEEDDALTLAAIERARPPAYFEVIRVPRSLPRTKPKACNFALSFARGEFVTIYDAEDVPEPAQLKKAVAVFRNVPDDVVCLQARLNYYNRSENLLTGMFALEYAALFDFMLPGLYALGIPIPLGGTSNHLRLSRLRELGEWDPYNVTEDADLGIRLAVEACRTLPVNSLTREEAPLTVGAWIRQRSRWIKGYMQTWQVAMRHTGRLRRRFGWKGFAGFQLFIGGASLVYLVAPILWAFSALWALECLGSGAAGFPSWLLDMSVYVFGAGMFVQWALAAVVVRQRKWRGMALPVVFFPFYWLLHSFASFRALWQFFLAPYHWEKTTHGVSRMIPGEKA